MTDNFNEEQRIQEQQYEYPYHYLPRVEDGNFSQTQYWSWGIHYFGEMRVVLDQLSDWTFDPLVDVGCGDGRFLREPHEMQPEVESLGIDYSERSIAMANGMNPHLTYEVRDILEDDLGRQFDVATCIEVLEHIPPEDCAAFVEAIAGMLAPDGKLVLTVPHVNKPVSDKHYQRFGSNKLADLFDPQFERVEFIPFDRQLKMFTALELAIGGRGNQFVINSPAVLNRLWRLYQRRYMYADTEANCRRIAAVCER